MLGINAGDPARQAAVERVGRVEFDNIKRLLWARVWTLLHDVQKLDADEHDRRLRVLDQPEQFNSRDFASSAALSDWAALPAANQISKNSMEFLPMKPEGRPLRKKTALAGASSRWRSNVLSSCEVSSRRLAIDQARSCRVCFDGPVSHNVRISSGSLVTAPHRSTFSSVSSCASGGATDGGGYKAVALAPARPLSFLSKNSCDRCSDDRIAAAQRKRKGIRP